MKKVLLAICLIYSTAYAQNCKLQKNEVDKFTGKMTKVTKPEKVISSFYTAGDFRVERIDTSFTFVFDYAISSYSNFEPYNIDAQSELIFLLTSGETVKIKSNDNIKGRMKTTVGIPPVYSCYLDNCSYTLTKDQVDSFFKSNVASIRFYRTASNGKLDYVDSEIKTKNSGDIANLLRCVN